MENTNNLKYECENCGDIFMEKHAHINKNQDEDLYYICPNCHSSDLIEVSEDTPLSDFYQS